jgi:hypothetical protein
MTTYTTLSNALVGVGAKPFATTIQALRDNPLAIAEGDVTAPKVQRDAIQGGAINRVKLSTGTNSGSYSAGSSGGAGSISLDAYSFFPQHSATAGSGDVAIAGGSTADTPTLRWSLTGTGSGTVRWRYILA